MNTQNPTQNPNRLLVLDHEPGNPLCRVQPDGKGWFVLEPEAE